ADGTSPPARAAAGPSPCIRPAGASDAARAAVRPAVRTRPGGDRRGRRSATAARRPGAGS
ncbi:hypothetical protein, partial [Kitasatospora sp. NPDC002965]|uniref:hypothetical protein n=1 Tax=Kitasatospora sp. NPDC002965 TaxID=3154775 RepID=UPI0033B72EE0